MKSKWSAMVVIAGLLLLAGCGALKEADPPRGRSAQKTEASFSEAEQRFALALFQDMIKEEGSRKNIFLSPYSIQQALLMTANGAAETAERNCSALYISARRIWHRSTGYQNLLIVLLKRCLTVNFHQLIRYGPKGS